MQSKQGIRAIVAEDDYFVCSAIVAALESLHYEVVGTARDGREAVEMACSQQADLVLMDIEMPELNGLEAARQIQQRCPTPIIVLTAYESEELLREASAAGVSAYLTKPPDAARIERAVTIAIARHGDLMALRQANQDMAAKNQELEQLANELARRNERLEAALGEIDTLRGILPLCSFCKRIRNDEGYWERVDSYIVCRTLAEISHSICPDCFEREYPEEHSLIQADKQRAKKEPDKP